MKIITAIGNPYINETLKKFKNCQVEGTDIQYQEGIIEVLEEKKDIDIVIISNILPEEYNFNILINKIKMLKEDIEIIVFLKEKNEDIEIFLNSKKIYKIYYLNDENYEIFFSKFNENESDLSVGLSREINQLKNMILNNKKDITIENKKINSIKRVNLNKEKKYKKIKPQKAIFNIDEDNKIVVVTGNFGVGKSIVSSILANVIGLQNKKVLLIDFDIFNNSINTIFGINKYPSNYDKLNFESLIKKINNNLDVICAPNHLFCENSIIRNDEINEIFEKLKVKYEFIVIDTSSNMNYKFVKTILSKGDKIIFLVEPNLSEIKKSNNLLEIFLEDFNIDVDKIKIVFNKVNKYQIAEVVLEELFSDFEIIGKINYEEKYNLLINKNMSKNIDKQEYEKIFEVLNA